MTVLHSVDFFPSGNASVAIEPRLPQADFPEHHHDFHEIVIVEHGTGIHVFNGQPYTITGGTVCFVRDHDRHLYEHTDNLCLTNVLYRSPDRFQFLAGLNQLLPQELDGQYPSHWRVNHSVLQQVRQLVAQMEQQEGENDLPSTASREILFMQLLLLLRKSSLLVCPASFDLGEKHKVAVLSVTEGEDKPLKYPHMFAAASLMLLNKVDLLPYLNFDVEKCIACAREVNPEIEIILISATSGEGMDQWLNWLETQRCA